MKTDQTNAFRKLPSVDKLLAESTIRSLIDTYSHEAVVALVREEIEEARNTIAAGLESPSLLDITTGIVNKANARWHPRFVPVINATGVILHTNLGRALLSEDSIKAVIQTAQSYSNLEFNLESGERGSRYSHILPLLRQLTGAEDAIIVNNNASAVLLTLTALCKDKEVIISRSEAVEIGGGFRIPDVLKQSGAQLIEVGTTNRTYSRDFEAAITPNTGALLRVHSSNFKIVGFTHSVELADLVKVGTLHALPVIDDLGSGSLIDTTRYGMEHEPTVQESVSAGADVICFSGDKLLGGPQAGIIVGRKKYISRIARHPLTRAVRIDKMTLAALAATLVHYVKNEAADKIPVWRMISENAEEICRRAQSWASYLGEIASVVPGESTVGGGSLPGSTLPTFLLSIMPTSGLGAAEIAGRLRAQENPVIARIDRDCVLFDPRTVLPSQEEILLSAIMTALGRKQ